MASSTLNKLRDREGSLGSQSLRSLAPRAQGRSKEAKPAGRNESGSADSWSPVHKCHKHNLSLPVRLQRNPRSMWQNRTFGAP